MTNPLAQVKSWLYHIGGITPEKVAEIGAQEVDMVVVDQADNNLVAFDQGDVAALSGPSEKLVISYLSVGEAETYRPYWQSSWETTPPDWIGEENPEWEGNVKVAYWEAEWKNIVFSMVDDIVDAGFNGLYLDIIDAYYYWEDAAPNADPDHYRDLMIEFVAEIKARAEARLAANGDASEPFAIIGQNGEDLAADPAYLDIIDGIGKEDLYYYYPNGAVEDFGTVPPGWLTGSQELLETAHDAGVEIFVVEYVPEENIDSIVAGLRQEIAYLSDMDIPLYVASTRALDQIEISITSDGLVNILGQTSDDTIRGSRWHDVIEGEAGHDLLEGLSGKDWLFGGNHNDILRGGAGDDHIAGNGGRDRAVGGQGADVFIFAPGDQKFVICDFTSGEDQMDISAFDFVSLEDLDQRRSIESDNLVLDLGPEILIFKNTQWSDLSAEDFIF